MDTVSMSLGLPWSTLELGLQLDVGDLAVLVIGTFVATAPSAVTGVGVKALVRNQVPGLVAILLLAFLGVEWLAAVDTHAVAFTRFGAAAVLAGGPAGGTLSWGAAVMVLVAWTASLLVAAVVPERRGDLA